MGVVSSVVVLSHIFKVENYLPTLKNAFPKKNKSDQTDRVIF